jgi:xanthine dehydrogenase YagR molybdenum-binding subunit
MAGLATRAVGSPLSRLEGREKVTGHAVYAFEHDVEGAVYASAVASTIAAGEIRGVDVEAALAMPGVLAVLWHGNAPRLGEAPDPELEVFQSAQVAYRGQLVAGVVADGLEAARDAANALSIDYAPREHDVVLRADHPGLYTPEKVNPTYPAVTAQGDVEAALAGAEVVHDATYSTPAEHNNPMEPHAAIASWEGGDLVVYDSTQGASSERDTLAKLFDLPPERVRVLSHHVGGGFGSKGTARPHVVLAAMAARVVERPVKVALTRQQLFAMVGYRTPTIQRVRLGANAAGELTAIAHEVVEQSSTLKEFAEQTATPTRVMYAAPNRLTSHRLARLDVPTPSWMRAPGETPGMYALESAMDELAVACGVDPVELRVRNEPAVDPESGKAWSSRNLVACLREGAERFGWTRAREARREGRWLVGAGVAASTYPAYQRPSEASARALGDGRFEVRVAAADIGTGARTVLAQIAADALGVEVGAVHIEIGESAFGTAPVAGGSAGTASWGTAVVKACRTLLEQGGTGEVSVDTSDDLEARADLARHGFGAQFCEVRVDGDTGEIRVPRMLGVFAVGRIINPKTARSQLIGGMTMGLGMALMEEGVMDAQFGDYLNHDLAQYHVPACADVRDIDAAWIDEEDDELNPMGSKGIGEIGIVGAAAAIANAFHHATGIRLRDLPLRPDRVLEALTAS